MSFMSRRNIIGSLSGVLCRGVKLEMWGEGSLRINKLSQESKKEQDGEWAALSRMCLLDTKEPCLAGPFQKVAL